MWVQIKSAPNLMIAEMWKELFEGEGIPTRLLSDPNSSGGEGSSVYRVLVPEEKNHVIEEILRKV
jgi:hypothetical protein